jgi:hypothetical protein
MTAPHSSFLKLSLICSILAPVAAFAQFTLQETGGTFRTGATNLSASATAIGQDELDLGTHFIASIKDGVYGNSSSWIGAAVESTVNGSWVGLAFSAPTSIGSFAFGRDNTGTLSDRTSFSPFRIQYTTSADVLTTTPTWQTIGDITYTGAAIDARRHLYDLTTPLTNVTGFRIMTASGIAQGNAIDEIEVYATAAAIPEPSTYAALAGLGALGLVLWRRRQHRAA